MEIVSKITEPNLVWNIFTYVAESPITKEKRKQLREMGTDEVTLRNLTQLFRSGKLTPEKTPDDLKEFIMEWKSYCFIRFNYEWEGGEPLSLSPYFPLFEPDTYVFAESNGIDRELYESWAEIFLPFYSPLLNLPLKIVPVRFWAFMRDDDCLEEFDVREYLG